MNSKQLLLALAASTVIPASSIVAVIAANTVTVSGANSANSSGSNFTHTNDRTGLSATLTDANLITVTHSQGFSAATQYLTQGTTGTLDATVIYTWTTPLSDQLINIAIWNHS